HVARRVGFEMHGGLRVAVLLPDRDGEEGEEHRVHERRDVADVARDVVLRATHVERHQAVADDEAEHPRGRGETDDEDAEQPRRHAVDEIEHRPSRAAEMCSSQRSRARIQSVVATTPEGSPPMEFEYSKKTRMYMEQLTDFMNKHIYPNEHVFHEQLEAQPTRWAVPPIMEELKAVARERGLWNLFLPESERGAGLTNLEYAP